MWGLLYTVFQSSYTTVFELNAVWENIQYVTYIKLYSILTAIILI